MLETFLDQVRNEGKVRVLSSQDAHDLNRIEIAPVVTREYQVGVLLQDRTSGKSWMIEIGEDSNTIDDFEHKLLSAMVEALNCKLNLQSLMQKKAST